MLRLGLQAIFQEETVSTQQNKAAKQRIGKYRKLFGVGPVGMMISLAILGLLWLSDLRLGHARILGQPGRLRVLGLVFIGLWICWHVWCLRTIRQWWFQDRLCTTGPYRLVRHPIYAGGISLGFLGVALMFNSWIILLWPILSCSVLCILVRKEEVMMTEVFGEEYKRYAGQTGRFFPRFFQ
jgi:protein-S-isoprenylcysteine O-methyltransferase Ste14